MICVVYHWYPCAIIFNVCIIFDQDKLMLEPFSLQKDMLYVVACHNDTALINEAKQFFTELSITYDVSSDAVVMLEVTNFCVCT